MLIHSIILCFHNLLLLIDDLFPLIPGLAATGPRADGGRDHSLHGGGPFVTCHGSIRSSWEDETKQIEKAGVNERSILIGLK